VTVAEEFADELTELLALAGGPKAIANRVAVTAGNLEIAVSLGETVEVALAGFRHEFAAADDEDGRDAAALALDLIGAALFGAARVVVERFGGLPRRFSLQLGGPGGWQTVAVQGSRPWNPLARATTQIHLGDVPRPPRYRASEVAPLPWAPWAGAVGFFGARATDAPADLPVDGELDLHNFHPREVKPLVLAYLDACLARGITEVRIVHGKGIGHLRRTVHALLDRHPRVRRYRLAGHGGGGWGATLVDLSPETGEDRG
jgi:hypothetical protein